MFLRGYVKIHPCLLQLFRLILSSIHFLCGTVDNLLTICLVAAIPRYGVTILYCQFYFID